MIISFSIFYLMLDIISLSYVTKFKHIAPNLNILKPMNFISIWSKIKILNTIIIFVRSFAVFSFGANLFFGFYHFFLFSWISFTRRSIFIIKNLWIIFMVLRVANLNFFWWNNLRVLVVFILLHFFMFFDPTF